MSTVVWQKCLKHLEAELTPQQFNTWIRPLQAVESDNTLELLAPNRFVLDWINDKYSPRIQSLLAELSSKPDFKFDLRIGSHAQEDPSEGAEDLIPSPRRLRCG